MSDSVLDEIAERCIRLAYQCENRNAERFLRLLAVDLMLAAEQQRPPAPPKARSRAFEIVDEFAELDRLSRHAAGAALTPESVSTA